PPGAKPGILGVLPAPEASSVVPKTAMAYAPAPASVTAPAVQAAAIPSSENKPRSGWIIQVGAYEDIAEAREKMNIARAKAAGLLQGSDPFTETVVKGDKTLYRARFAGLKQDQAEAACRALKRSEIVCMAIRN
ncbi:MAG: SPOR domain-containing protein, partial [Pseudorhodoplanes sp.]